MSSYEDQESDQFKLISLEANAAIKPGAQKAKQAYSSYLKDDSTSSGTSPLSVNEEAEPAPVAEKKTSTKQSAKPPAKAPPPKQEEKPASVVNKFTKKAYYTDEEEAENSSSNIDNVNQKIDEFKESVANLWANFVSTVSAIFLKAGAILIKPLVAIAGFTAKIMSVPLQISNRLISSLATSMGLKNNETGDNEEIEEETQAPEIKTSNFSEMIELNIFFTDNYKKNLYNKSKSPGFKLSRMEETLIVNMAIDAIKECAEFTAELPPPSTGMYAGKGVSNIMEEATEQDINIFLGFVKAFPGKYIGKSWKISETFATWLINNSPTG